MSDESTLSAEKERMLEEDLRASLIDERLHCAIAFKVAKKHGVAPRTVGDMANKLGLKISACQLGCFP